MSARGRVLLFTGDGKGKTTAAFGAVLRAAGHGWKVLVIQFIKSNSKTGELAACRHLPGVEVVQRGCGFVPPPDDPRFKRHQEAAQSALDLATESVTSKRFDLIVLDEVCTAVARKLISASKVADLVKHRPQQLNLILTGRGAGRTLISLADTATEMRCIKHAWQQGIRAQKGVEF